MTQHAVLLLILFFGGILTFVVPPIQSADEDSHLKRAIMVANGNIATRFDGSRWGQDVPKTLVEYVDAHRYLVGQPDARYSYARWYADSHAPSDNGETVFHSYSGQSASPLYYLPQVIGIWVGKLAYAVTPAEFNWSAAQYFARLGNLLVYAAVFAWGLRSIPRYTALLSFVALTPMSLSLAASASYDVTVILSAVAFFIAAMRTIENPGSLNRYGWGLLIFLAFALGHSKSVYAPVMLLLFLLIKPLGMRRFFYLAGACGAAAIVGLLVSTALFGLSQDVAFQEAMKAQRSHVVSHFLETAGMVLSSIWQTRDFLFFSLLGNFGWLDTNLPSAVLVLWFGVGIWAVVSDARGARTPYSGQMAALALSGSVIATYGLFVVLYITWTSVISGIGGPTVDGVQGRYLLPLMPFVMAGVAALLALVLPQRPVRSPWTMQIQLVASSVVAATTVFAMIVRYWIPSPT